MKAWCKRHPNQMVGYWLWGVFLIAVVISSLGIIPAPEMIADSWYLFGILIWVGGIWVLCFLNLIIKQRSLGHLFWLLLQGLGAIIIMCLKDKRDVVGDF